MTTKRYQTTHSDGVVVDWRIELEEDRMFVRLLKGPDNIGLTAEWREATDFTHSGRAAGIVWGTPGTSHTATVLAPILSYNEGEPVEAN